MKNKRLLMTFWLYVIGIITLYAQPHSSQIWQDTTLLYHAWDTALDTTNYTSAEKNRQKQINERLGHEWVLSYYPFQDAQEFGDLNRTLSLQERHIDFEDITPYTWKWILLRTPEGRIHLRRPNWWLKLHQVEKGKPLALSMPEMQLNVVGQVEQILPNLLDSRFPPAPRDGDYAWLPITAWMERMAPEVWSYVFSSGDTIKATPNHPVFSKDRERFVAIGELSFGEVLLNKAAIEMTLVGKSRLPEVQVVNNLEVWRGHTFSVSDKNIVAHNGCPVIFSVLPNESNISDFKNIRYAEYEKYVKNLPKLTGKISIIYLREIGQIGTGRRRPKFGITNFGLNEGRASYLAKYFGRYSDPKRAAIEGNAAEDLRALIIVPSEYDTGIEKILGDFNIKNYGGPSDKPDGGIIHRDVDSGEHYTDDQLASMKKWLYENYPDWETIFDISAHKWKNYVFENKKK